MGEFDHPPVSFESRVSLYEFLLLSPGPDVRYEAAGFRRLFFTHVRRVQAKILGHVLRRGVGDSSFQQRLKGNTIVPVGPGDDERQGDAIFVDEKISLCPIFFPCPSGWVRRTLVPAAL